MQLKVCRKCNESKPLSEYRSHRSFNCNTCFVSAQETERTRINNYQREYVRSLNPDKKEARKQRALERYYADPQERQANNFYYKYGITKAEAISLQESQGNKCAICEQELTDSKKTHVDHCHETNKVRGILCLHCNTGLGHFKDNPELLRKAIAYLDRPN